ncbi:sensor histidine kinase [Aureibacter tunicatorum]|uniref:histidine kinase n=1 Tax=Aureibacter tunicatorum TaxID=866807 RepID=A0AAE3XS54_9BACT|nr:ATP-binding protein [Aureibacter tunicatorum]MDR6241034.1 two-component system phosphate regulon sensor histidine kinase PhoR [Aureibacter tunicatorum]BDD03812.1 two-component sensor histidine kinase [Aureibacter tunicatorum]
MLFTSRGVAALLSISISIVTTAFLSLVNGVSIDALVVAFLIAFGSSYLLISITFESLIFKEVNQIYSMLSDLKKNDFEFIKKHKKYKKSRNPMKRVKQEIYSYASSKQREIDELKKLEAFRREFLADVSHELKTPIFAAQGFIYTLLDGAVEDETVRVKFLKRAGKSLDGLANLVQNLLSISRMESGDIQLEFEDFDIYKLTQEIYEQFEAKAEKKQIKLIFSEEIPDKVVVFADRQRIMQVLMNLISNAMKYTESPSEVEVDFKVGEKEVTIYVKDTGLGIPPEDLKRIFERFYRVEKSRSKDKGGTGLGLAIVRHILQAHGNTVSVVSTVGKGSTFSFKLPKGEVKQALEIE